MATQKPEAPESSRERDVLRRWPFAHSIYQVIQRAPSEWSLRIGIYGRWGEGKTTVLNFIEQMAEKDNYPVAKFNPWAAQDRKELWKALILGIENAFKTGSLSKAKMKAKAEEVLQSETAKKTLQEGFKLVGLGEVAGAIGGLLGPMIQNQVSLAKRDAEQVIRKNLGDRKLIVLVDDLDRADPDLVPYLLMGLRELLDLQQCAFVMGLDPFVISNALSKVHAGWGSTPEFLEKIIDFPFWLPPVQDHDIRRLVDQELNVSPVNLDRYAFAEVIHLLPTNPRKLKHFLRGLWRFQAQIDRHEEAETEWIIVLLLELLRAVSFKTGERLLANKELWNELQRSSFKGHTQNRSEKEAIEEEKWIRIMTTVVSEDRDKDENQKEAERTEFCRVMNSMKDLISLEKWGQLHYWARLEDNPPILTWKEFKKFFQELEEKQTKVHLEKLIKSHADRLQINVAGVAKDLFETIINYREQLLSHAADSGPESELIEAISKADICLSMIRILISELQGFSSEPPFLLTEDFMKMFGHFSKWAHFINPQYQDVRAQEASVLKLAAQNASRMAVEILEALESWNPLRGPMMREAQALKDRLNEELIPYVLNELRQRFTRKDGINSLWGHERYLAEKWILFRRDGGFYSEDGLKFLESMVERANADKDTIIHSNLLQFVSMLGHALKHGLKVLGPSEVHPLASDKVIIPLLWQGAVSRKIQPRMIGSLKETRARLAEFLGSEELLPLPEWWDNVSPETLN